MFFTPVFPPLENPPLETALTTTHPCRSFKNYFKEVPYFLAILGGFVSDNCLFLEVTSSFT